MAGARQTDKTTRVEQVTRDPGLPLRFTSADEPTLRGREWIATQWEAACAEVGPNGGLVVALGSVPLLAGEPER